LNARTATPTIGELQPGSAPKEPLPGAAPVKDPNPPEADNSQPAEVPKVGSRDAPGG